MNNPVKILQLWNKAVRKHEEGHEPKDLARKGQEQKLRIKKGLTALRFQAAGGLSNPAHHPAFLAMQARLVKAMKRYCRYLKTARDEDRARLPRFLKAVKQLTLLVERLAPDGLELGEEEVGLDALEAVDVTAFDEGVDEGDTDAGDEDLSLPAMEEIAQAADQTTDNAQAVWKARLPEAMRGVKEALQAGVANLPAIKEAFTQANDLAGKSEFAAAVAALDRLGPLLAEARGEGKAAQGAPAGTVIWQTARLDAIGQIRRLQEALVKTKHRPALEIARELESVPQTLQLDPTSADSVARLRDFLQKNRTLHKAETIPNPWGLAIDIRGPLLKVLDRLA